MNEEARRELGRKVYLDFVAKHGPLPFKDKLVVEKYCTTWACLRMEAEIEAGFLPESERSKIDKARRRIARPEMDSIPMGNR